MTQLTLPKILYFHTPAEPLGIFCYPKDPQESPPKEVLQVSSPTTTSYSEMLIPLKRPASPPLQKTVLETKKLSLIPPFSVLNSLQLQQLGNLVAELLIQLFNTQTKAFVKNGEKLLLLRTKESLQKEDGVLVIVTRKITHVSQQNQRIDWILSEPIPQPWKQSGSPDDEELRIKTIVSIFDQICNPYPHIQEICIGTVPE